MVSTTSCERCWTWAWTASRPTSASGSRRMSCTTTAPTRSRCTTITRYLYNKAVFEVLEEKLGKGEAMRVRALGNSRRAAVPGSLGRRLLPRRSNRWPRACAAGCRSACPGSASGATTSAASSRPHRRDVYKRWVAFGLLSSHSRLHGSNSYRVPWLFDEEAVDVLRHFTKLKMQADALPVQQSCGSHAIGVPMMRAMVLEFVRRSDLRSPGSAIHARR